MKKLLAALGLLASLIAPSVSEAQSNPGLVFGQVPSAAQWNSYFSAKQNVITLAGNTVYGNATGNNGAPIGLAMPACGGALNALIWVSDSGFGCNAFGSTVNPGGSPGQMQYNLAGTLAGFSGMTVSGSNLTISAPTNHTGTVTLPDGATWTSTGLSNLATYTQSANAPFFLLTPNINFSQTTGSTIGFESLPVMTPTGASAATIIGNFFGTAAGSYSGTVSSFTNVRIGINNPSGFSGNITTLNNIFAAPTGGTTANIANMNNISLGNWSNGTGITAGTVTNTQIAVGTITSVPGIGGSIVNNDITIALPSGTNAGTATNCGLCISGAGQTGGTVTNWAINSTSAASSQITGGLINTPISGSTGTFTTLTLSGTQTVNNAAINLRDYTADAFGVPLTFNKSRSATVGAQTIVQSGDTLGDISFNGSDGSNFRAAANIYVTVDGAPSTGTSVPGKIIFQTASGGTLRDVGNWASNGVFSVSSGLANSVTLAGGASSVTLGSSAGDIVFNPGGFGTVLDLFSNGSSVINYFTMFGNTSGNAPLLYAKGSDTDVSLQISTQGAGIMRFTTGGLGSPVQGMVLTPTGFNVGDGTYSSFNATAPQGNSWVNFVNVVGNITGQPARIIGTGSDANPGLNIMSKGTGSIGIFTESASPKQQFAFLDNASGADYWEATSGSAAGSLTTNAGNGTIGTAGGTTTFTDATTTFSGATTHTIAAATVALTGIASSAGALDAVCWNATGGVLTHNSAGALCSASLEELKDKTGDITAADADADLMALKPFWGKFKDSVTSISDHRVQPFFGAHQVEGVDDRLVEYDDDGKLRSVRYANITALLTASYQHQREEIEDLRSRLSSMEKLLRAALSKKKTAAH